MDDKQTSTPLEQAQATPASSDAGVKPELNTSMNIGKTSSKCHKNHKRDKTKAPSKTKHNKKSKKRIQSSEESSSSEEEDDDSEDDSDSSSSEENTKALTKKQKRKLKLKKLLQKQTKKLLQKEKRKRRKQHITSSSESSTESDDSEDATDDETRHQHTRSRAIRNRRNATLEDSDEEDPDEQDDRAAQIDNIQLALDGLRMQKTYRSNNALYGGGRRGLGLGLQAGRRHLRKGLSEDEAQGHSRYKYKRVDEIWDSESCTWYPSSRVLTFT